MKHKGIVLYPGEFEKFARVERAFNAIGVEFTEELAQRYLDLIRQSPRDRVDDLLGKLGVPQSADPSFKCTENIPVESDPHGSLTRGKWRGIPGDPKAFGAIRPEVSGNPRRDREVTLAIRQGVKGAYAKLGQNARKKIKRFIAKDDRKVVKF